MNNIKHIILKHDPRMEYPPELVHYGKYPKQEVFCRVEGIINDLVDHQVLYNIVDKLDE